MGTIPYLPRIIVFAVLLCATAACEKGNGVMTTRTFELEAFDKIDLQRHADIYITQGTPRTVTIEAEENLMDLITTDVNNGEWQIGFSKAVKEYLTMTIHITMPDIHSLKVTEGSGGDIVLENMVETDNLYVELSGDGSISGELAATDTLTTRLEGSGSITLSGTAIYHLSTNNGTGTIGTYNLVSNTGRVEVLGSGDSQVHFLYAWQASITNTGNILYKGVAPTSTEITGSGTVSMAP